MTVEEKSCQLATLYGYNHVPQEPLPTEGWKKAIWKDGIGNIDEMHNGFVRKKRPVPRPELVYPFSNHVEAIRSVQRWFVEETRLGIPVDFSNEGIHGLTHTKATPLPAPIGIGATWNRSLVRRARRSLKPARDLSSPIVVRRSAMSPVLVVARQRVRRNGE